jgi:hypothetical protein
MSACIKRSDQTVGIAPFRLALNDEGLAIHEEKVWPSTKS